MKKISKFLTITAMCLASLFALTACNLFGYDPKVFNYMEELGFSITLDTSFNAGYESFVDDSTGDTYGYVEFWSVRYSLCAIKDTISSYAEDIGVENLYEFAENFFFSEDISGAPLAIKECSDGEHFFYYSTDSYTNADGKDVNFLNVVMEGEEHYYLIYFACLKRDYEEAKIMEWARSINVA